MYPTPRGKPKSLSFSEAKRQVEEEMSNKEAAESASKIEELYYESEFESEDSSSTIINTLAEFSANS